MSYVRFGEEESDVYVYLDCGGYLCCCGCVLDPPGYQHYDTSSMVEHLRNHMAAGHTVPSHVIPSLEHEQAENDKWIEEFEEGGVGG